MFRYGAQSTPDTGIHSPGIQGPGKSGRRSLWRLFWQMYPDKNECVKLPPERYIIKYDPLAEQCGKGRVRTP